MKKFLKFGAVLTALALGLVCFVACGEEEESRSVEAEYKEANYYSSSYIFYSDNTYELKEGFLVIEKGKYSGSATTIGRVTIIQPSSLAETGEYIPENGNYVLLIEKNGADLYLHHEDNEYPSYIKI